MKDIAPILRSLGLLESEVKTYLMALEKGPGTVLDFAKVTKLSRQAIYVAIESLTERGLMSSVLRGKKRFYAAEHPEKLLAYAQRREAEMKERIKDLERTLPEIELQLGGERPVVKVFEGKEGIRAIIQDMREHPSKNPIEITDTEAMDKVLKPEDLQGMRMELKKGNVFIKGLYTYVPEKTTLEGERILLPKEYRDFRTNIGIYENIIVMVTFEGKMHSVIVESKPLVKTMRILFELALKGVSNK